MDICSAIVYCKPELIKENVDWLNSQDGVETHQIDDLGKIIVTVEDVEKDVVANKEFRKASDVISGLQKRDEILSIMLVSQYSDADSL